MNSSTSRDLPTPAAPSSVNRYDERCDTTLSKSSRRRWSSRSRPTIGESRRRTRPADVGVDLEQPIRRDGRALALELELDGLDLHRVPDELLRLLPDQDLARLCVLLEPGRDVDGVARDERIALAGHDLARVHADPRLQPDRRDGRSQLDRGANSPERVVLVRLRDAEDRHHGVADELLHRAAVPLEDAPRESSK